MYCAANSRNAYPAMYWSLCGFTRNPPAKAGYPSARTATAYTSDAHPSAKRGAQALGAASGDGARVRSTIFAIIPLRVVDERFARRGAETAAARAESRVP